MDSTPAEPRIPLEFSWGLPDWVGPAVLAGQIEECTTEQAMRLALRLAEQNGQSGAGGPFAALIFDRTTNRLVSAGVNMVLAAKCSVLHAEVVALMLAQHALGTHDLRAAGSGNYELITTTEPCAMCLGAIPWSGLVSLVCGSRDEDARAAGFDEGAKPRDWVGELTHRGIAVTRDLCRNEAAEVLQKYRQAGGRLY